MRQGQLCSVTNEKLNATDICPKLHLDPPLIPGGEQIALEQRSHVKKELTTQSLSARQLATARRRSSSAVPGHSLLDSSYSMIQMIVVRNCVLRLQ